MERVIKEEGYLAHLGTEVRRRQYYNWKERMLPRIDAIGESFRTRGFAVTMKDFALNNRDAVLLMRLHYLHESEIPEELVALEKESLL